VAIAAFALFPPAAGAWSQRQGLSGRDAAFHTVAATTDGGAVAAWIRPVGDEYNFESRTRAADGTLGPVQLIASTEGRETPGDVDVDGAGRAVFVWGGPDGIKTRTRTDDGTLGHVRALYGAPGFRPRVAVNPAGDAAFVWTRFMDGSMQVQARLEAADGTLGPLRMVSARGQNAEVEIDSSGNAVFVWGGRPAHTRALSTDGAMSPVQDISPPRRAARETSLAVDPGGRAAFTWRIDYPRGRYDQVQTRTRAPNGHLGPVETLSPPERPAILPDVAIDASGEALVAWTAGECRLARFRRPGSLVRSNRSQVAAGSSRVWHWVQTETG
jgi:hypothetical protein